MTLLGAFQQKLIEWRDIELSKSHKKDHILSRVDSIRTAVYDSLRPLDTHLSILNLYPTSLFLTVLDNEQDNECEVDIYCDSNEHHPESVRSTLRKILPVDINAKSIVFWSYPDRHNGYLVRILIKVKL